MPGYLLFFYVLQTGYHYAEVEIESEFIKHNAIFKFRCRVGRRIKSLVHAKVN